MELTPKQIADFALEELKRVQFVLLGVQEQMQANQEATASKLQWAVLQTKTQIAITLLDLGVTIQRVAAICDLTEENVRQIIETRDLQMTDLAQTILRLEDLLPDVY